MIRNSSLTLPRSTPPQPAHKFRMCTQCQQPRPPEGGVEVRAGSWMCAHCWGLMASKKRRAA